MPKVLIVDDDTKLVHMMVEWLEDEGYTVESIDNGLNALSLMKSFGFDVIVLDWDLPGMIGPDVCKTYRDLGGDTPVLMLTGKGAIEEKEKGFLTGADDYLTKPFHPKELSLRIRALMGRRVVSDKRKIQYGSLTLDLSKSAVFANGVDLKLSAREYSLLDFLIRHPEQVFNADALIDRVWKSDHEVSDKAVRVCVARLRQKLDAHDCPTIVTLPGFGYQLSAQVDSNKDQDQVGKS